MGTSKRRARIAHRISLSWPSWIAGATLLGTISYAVAEDITLTTYYPSPRGNYKEVRVQDRLVIGNPATPDQSAALEIAVDPANPRGLLVPRLSKVDRDKMQANAGGTLPPGLVIYNTTSGQLEFIDKTGTFPPPVGIHPHETERRRCAWMLPLVQSQARRACLGGGGREAREQFAWPRAISLVPTRNQVLPPS